MPRGTIAIFDVRMRVKPLEVSAHRTAAGGPAGANAPLFDENAKTAEPGSIIEIVTLTLKAKVRGGRLVLDEPVDLPEGSVVDLVPVDDGDHLDDEDRAKLHAALERAEAQMVSGQSVPAAEVLRRLGINAGR